MRKSLRAVMTQMWGLFCRPILDAQPTVIDSGSGSTFVQFPTGEQSFIRY